MLDGLRSQQRECLACGCATRRVLARQCAHVWKQHATGLITDKGAVTGRYYELKCIYCGDMMERRL